MGAGWGSGIMPAHSLRRRGVIGAGSAASAFITAAEAIPNLASHWRLGDASGTNAVDRKGAVNGTYTGTVTLGTAGLLSGDSDKAVTLGGGYVDLGANYLFNTPASANFTAICWFKQPSAGVAAIMGTTARTQGNGWSIEILSNGNMFGSYCASSSAAFLPSANTRYMAALGVAPGGVSTFWMNGAVVGSFTDARFTLAGSHTYIGHLDSGGGNLAGIVDDTLMYTRKLTTAEVLSLYNAG